MPRYFFNYRADGKLETDQQGIEMLSDEAAIEETRIGAREVAAQKVRVGDLISSQCFELMNANGAIVETISLRSVIRLEAEDA